MTTYPVPRHPVTDEAKYEALVGAMRTGADIPPVVVAPNGYALTGSHRIAAARATGYDLTSLTLTEEQYAAATEQLGEDLLDCSDGESVAAAIARTSQDPVVILALADQV